MKHFSYIFFDKSTQELLCSNGYVPPRETAQYTPRIEKQNYGSINVRIDSIAFPNVKNESNIIFTKRGIAITITHAGSDVSIASVIVFPRSESDLYDRLENALRASAQTVDIIESVLKILIEPLNLNTVMLFMRNLTSVLVQDKQEEASFAKTMHNFREQVEHLSHDDDSQIKFNIINELPMHNHNGLTLHDQRLQPRRK